MRKSGGRAGSSSRYMDVATQTKKSRASRRNKWMDEPAWSHDKRVESRFDEDDAIVTREAHPARKVEANELSSECIYRDSVVQSDFPEE